MIIAVVRNFVQLRKESLKKNSGLYHGIRTLNLCDTGAALCQFSCCCHLSHEFYRRVTVICLFHKALSFVYLSRLVFHRLITLGARDFSCAASGFGKVSV